MHSPRQTRAQGNRWVIRRSVQGFVSTLVCLSVCVRAFSGRGHTHVSCIIIIKKNKKVKKGRFQRETLQRVKVERLDAVTRGVDSSPSFRVRRLALSWFLFLFFSPTVYHPASRLPFDVTHVRGSYRMPCVTTLARRQAKIDKARLPPKFKGHHAAERDERAKQQAVKQIKSITRK